MDLKNIISILSIFYFILLPSNGSSSSSNSEEMIYDETKEWVIISFARFLNDNIHRIRQEVVEHIEEENENLINEHINSQLISQASKEFDFTTGELIDSLMEILYLDDPIENKHMAEYRHVGLSDSQIEEARLLIKDNFEVLKATIKEEADLSSVPYAKQHSYLTQMLGGQVTALLIRSMKLTEEQAFIAYTHLQRLERLNHSQEVGPEIDLRQAYQEWGKTSESDDTEESELETLQTYISTHKNNNQLRLNRFLGVGIIGFSVLTLISYLKDSETSSVSAE